MHTRLRTQEVKGRRAGKTNPVVVALLVGILASLVVLIVTLVRSGKATDESHASTSWRGETGSSTQNLDGAGGAGPTVVAQTPLPPEDRPKKIADPNRIKATLQKGKTYEVVLKGGFDGQVVDKAWAIKETVSIVYQAEMMLERTIEENDGEQIVELRHFVTARNAKVLAKVESVKIDLGIRGMLVLGGLEFVSPGSTEMLAVAKPVVEAILTPFSQRAVNARMVKAVGHVDSLSGKTIRIVYRDGMGVESLQPEGCSLNPDELDFVKRTAVLSDCYLMPNLKIAPGEPWSVNGSEMANFLDPTLRAFPSGEVELVREEEGVRKDDEEFAVLKIRRGVLRMNSTDSSMSKVGEFTPRGRIKYNLTEGFVSEGDLAGRFDIEEVSTNHILFETRFETHPTMQIQYSCKMR